jgi:hypothetical protein
MKPHLKPLLMALLTFHLSLFAAADSTPAPKDAGSIIIPRMEFNQAKLSEAVQFLIAKGRAAGIAPVNIVVLNAPKPEPTMTFVLGNIPLSDAVRYVAESSGMSVRRDATAFVIEPATKAPKAGATADSSGAAQKAEAIIIPRVQFRDAALAEALAFLRTRAAVLDPDPNPAQRGVNILAMPPAPGSPPVKLTLDLEKTSLVDTLRYVASLANLRLDAEPSALILRPKTAEESTKEPARK